MSLENKEENQVSTSLDITVNKETYDKYQAVCDAKELVSSTQITHNFLSGALLRIAASLLTKEEDNFKRYVDIGKKNDGNNELKEIYIPAQYQYELVVFHSDFKNMPDKDYALKGSLVLEINKQYKLFCTGKRGRKSH